MTNDRNHSPSARDGADESTTRPFGGPSPRGARRFVLPVAFGVTLAAAAALVFVFRGGRGPAGASAHHQPGAAADTSAAPVMLSAEGSRRIGVTFAPVTREPLTREVRTVAQVSYDETRVKAISPKLDGWVDRLDVDFTGQSVRAGDELLSIYSPMLVTAQQDLLLAERLRKDVSAGSADARRGADDLATAAERRLRNWDITQADIDRLRQTGEVRKTLTLRAPVSGVVVDKAVLAGQKVMAGELLYKVADLSTVWVEGEVFERDLPLVHLGAEVTAEFEALPGKPRSGRITYIYPTIDPSTRTARVRVALSNPDLALKPGMYATIVVEGGTHLPVLTVPRSAVLSTGERSMVFVRRADGMLEPRNVVLGVANDERVQILSGVAIGDTVVASATFLVDAESNLGTVMGGMGNMPGMDMTKPVDKAKTPPPAGR